MIIKYLLEELYLQEKRFELVQPKDYKFWGVDSIESHLTENGAITQFIAPYIFVFGDNLFDEDIYNTLIYPSPKTSGGYIKYDAKGKIGLLPLYVDSDGEEYDLTDNIINSNNTVKEYIDSIDDNLIVNVDLKFFFDLSMDDPSYDPEHELQTLNNSTPSEVFKKLNNVSFILKDYIDNFSKYAKPVVDKQVFGSKYSIFLSKLKYNLSNINFSAKEDFEGDTRRATIYNKWFKSIANELGNVDNINVDGVDFSIDYQNTQIG